MGGANYGWCLEENTGLAGGGGVFRGWNGERLGGFVEKMGVHSSVRAKLRAVLRGLLLAREKGYKKLVVYVDSIIVVGLLKGNMTCSARNNAIVQRCRSLLGSPAWEVVMVHCFREANQVVDDLANLGIGLDCEFMYFNDPPREVSTSLYADREGAKFSRFIVDQ